jgi:hypothetical protein
MEKSQSPWWAQYAIGVMVILSFDATLVGVFWIGDANMLIAMVQAVIGIVMLVLGYFFGSSDGSRSKTDAINSVLGKRDSGQQPVAIAVNNPTTEVSDAAAKS